MQRGIYRQDTLIGDVLKGTLLSYSQVFFSNSIAFAVLLLLASFIYPFIGFCGLTSVLVTQGTAALFHLNRQFIKEGVWGFNSLMIGMALGSLFQFSVPVFVLLVLASISTLVATVWVFGILQKYALPFFSFPFLLVIWLIIIAARQFNAIAVNDDQIYWMNGLYQWGGPGLLEFYQKINSVHLPLMLEVFLKSLGAIFFQNNIVTGTLIAIGLLVYSRIAFSLSVLGFTSAYLFYVLMGANVADLTVNYTGSNYIFAAIALGGFFIIPSVYSYLLVFFLTPVLAIIMLGCSGALAVLQLPSYSLAFSLFCLLLLYFLKNRTRGTKLVLVQWQNYSPEVNLYKQLVSTTRYKNASYFSFQLPVWGEWMVSQGYDGSITHLGDWAKALDFVILDEQMRSYALVGAKKEDFYCYNKPVVAPGAGWIEAVVNHVDDNEVGDVNTEDNWGNTLVIKHAWGLYTKLAHLKKDSIQVKPGDYINKGEVIAHCGSSGRSPEAHLHFQVQGYPVIGAQTMPYPVAYFIERDGNKHRFKTFETPKEGTFVSNISVNPLLSNAFGFVPGQKMEFEEQNETGEKITNEWEVFIDSYNNSYIYCHTSHAYAYFINDGVMFYFTEFYGAKKSLLYHFYLSCYKVLLGYYDIIQIEDELPIQYASKNILLWPHDVIAPFVQLVKVKYNLQYTEVDDIHNSGSIKMHSSVQTTFGGKNIDEKKFEITIENGKIQQFILIKNNIQLLSAICR